MPDAYRLVASFLLRPPYNPPMLNVQTIEIVGHRFVLVPEDQFRELEQSARAAKELPPAQKEPHKRFADVIPFNVSDESASEMLIRERR